ncbi:MAG: hypothetical protein ACOX4F_00910 [Atopobiaceae bacterium]|jgi:tetratricopeptide (TPR) repeat protein
MMDVHAEQRHRLLLKSQEKLDPLSDEAMNELELAIRADPASFVNDNSEEAFALFTQAIDQYRASRTKDFELTDNDYIQMRTQALDQLYESCQQILAIDPHCIDARVCSLLASDYEQDVLLDELLYIADKEFIDSFMNVDPITGDIWVDVFARPRLRLKALIARTYLESGRYKRALETCYELLRVSPLDMVGARRTAVLALARLADEDGFMRLEKQHYRNSDAWLHLAHTILLYKLGRMPAAKRALRGFNSLCDGAAYALLVPAFVDVYIPDRPGFEAGSYAESMLAVREADFIIQEVPDFPYWASMQDSFLHDAYQYSQDNRLMWPGDLDI